MLIRKNNLFWEIVILLFTRLTRKLINRLIIRCSDRKNWRNLLSCTGKTDPRPRRFLGTVKVIAWQRRILSLAKNKIKTYRKTCPYRSNPYSKIVHKFIQVGAINRTYWISETGPSAAQPPPSISVRRQP